MKKALFIALACIVLASCAAPSVVTGNSRSVVIDSGQYISDRAGIMNNAVEPVVKAEADKWCAKYNRVSGIARESQDRRRKEFECVEK